jgi:NAD(P)-dependent dehydrogenase (short-subunit alcohol dehydrogenase family)
MRIRDAVPVITGAAAGIGRAVAFELARREVHGLALVDHRESVAEVARAINERAEDWVCFSFRGDVTDVEFRRTVYRETIQRCGTVNICVPASACRRGESLHRQVETEVISPVSWALEMVADIGRSQAPQTCTNGAVAWNRVADRPQVMSTSSPVTVTVSTNSPPTVTITNPTNGASSTAPTAITIQASASDHDGSVK